MLNVTVWNERQVGRMPMLFSPTTDAAVAAGYAPQLYAPVPAFSAPPAEPGYFTAQSVVAPQPFYDYAPGYWGR
jgi:hypothetical protein